MKGRINVRVKSISNQVLKRTLAHNYRTRKDLDNVDTHGEKESLKSA